MSVQWKEGLEKRSIWVFRTPQQKWDSDKIQTYRKGKDICIIEWAGFSIKGGRSQCSIIEQDPEAKKNGYTAKSYLQVLNENLPIIYEPGLIFMQDNASIHTAEVIKAWFEERLMMTLNHPPYSPDLNPIEHLWKKLKELVSDLHPELDGSGTGEDQFEALEKAIQEAWDFISQSYLDAAVNRMKKRCEAVIKAKGWQTKY